MIDLNSIDKTVVHKRKIKDQGNDFLYWQSIPYDIRLATIELIRQEYNLWKYGTEQRLQRVYIIIKRK